MSRSENRYGPRYGFPPLKGSNEEIKHIENMRCSQHFIKENNKPIKKVKVTIPALGVEKIFNSLKECCDTFGVEDHRIYTYIRMGYAAKGIMLFKWED